MPEGWQPRPIPHANQDDTNVSRMMEALGIANPSTEQSVVTLVDRVVALESKCCRDAGIIREMKVLMPDLRNLKMELLSIRSGTQQDISQVRNNIDSVNSSTGFRLDRVEELTRKPISQPEAIRVYQEPPLSRSYLFLWGSVRNKGFLFFCSRDFRAKHRQFQG
ncbi:hypothetical protein MJO29_003080 [Puccinia striiformis f. sp. tritici]|nr:hypothetical protein MJO29_003080 [Puccinia striiformis f. sp. tritici]